MNKVTIIGTRISILLIIETSNQFYFGHVRICFIFLVHFNFQIMKPVYQLCVQKSIQQVAKEATKQMMTRQDSQLNGRINS